MSNPLRRQADDGLSLAPLNRSRLADFAGLHVAPGQIQYFARTDEILADVAEHHDRTLGSVRDGTRTVGLAVVSRKLRNSRC